jgi:hypothetical protein
LDRYSSSLRKAITNSQVTSGVDPEFSPAPLHLGNSQTQSQPRDDPWWYQLLLDDIDFEKDFEILFKEDKSLDEDLDLYRADRDFDPWSTELEADVDWFNDIV